MRVLFVVLLLLSSACTTDTSYRGDKADDDDKPKTYLKCSKRYDYYRCCPRDLDTNEIVGECFNMSKDD